MLYADSNEPSAWLEERLRRDRVRVDSFIPSGFEAYARVFHPLYQGALSGQRLRVRWSDIAAANGRSLDAEMSLLDESSSPEQYASDGRQLWDDKTLTGSMSSDMADRLAAILGPRTNTPAHCWFAVWEGWGDLRVAADWDVRVSIPLGRELILLRGDIADVRKSLSNSSHHYRSANLWWPDDRSWCVATEIDLCWTYVGGSAACIQEILADAELEAIPVNPEDGNFMERDSATG